MCIVFGFLKIRLKDKLKSWIKVVYFYICFGIDKYSYIYSIWYIFLNE